MFKSVKQYLLSIKLNILFYQRAANLPWSLYYHLCQMLPYQRVLFLPTYLKSNPSPSHPYKPCWILLVIIYL